MSVENTIFVQYRYLSVSPVTAMEKKWNYTSLDSSSTTSFLHQAATEIYQLNFLQQESISQIFVAKAFGRPLLKSWGAPAAAITIPGVSVVDEGSGALEGAHWSGSIYWSRSLVVSNSVEQNWFKQEKGW